MRRLVLLCLALVVGLSAPAPVATATEGSPAIEAPGIWTPDRIEFTVTVDRKIRFRIDESYVDESLLEVPVPRNTTYDLQVRRSSMLATRAPRWRDRRTGTASRRQVLQLGRGKVLCVRVRQHSYGLTSPWSVPLCLVRGRDDASVARSGSLRIVKDRRYLDRRATVIADDTGRLRVAGVPKGARYGVVRTDLPVELPEVGIEGGRRATGCAGGFSGLLVWCARRAGRAGTMVVRVDYGPSTPIGAVFVIPRWIR